MKNTRAERFSALDEQLELTLRNAGGQPVAVVVGGGEPFDHPPRRPRPCTRSSTTLASGTEPLLTTTGAADFLGVSRPYLTRLLKASRLPYRKTGNRHLVPVTALCEFKARRDRQLDQLDRLAAAEEDLGLR